MAPTEEFYAKFERIPLEKCKGKISTESVMCYPPGIPILEPGELVKDEVLTYIREAKERGSQLPGTEAPAVEYLCVVK